MQNICDFRGLTILNSTCPLHSTRNTRNPNYRDLPLMRDTATTTALKMNLYRHGHSTTYTIMGARDYNNTYGVTPQLFLVFPTVVEFDDDETAFYLSLYN